MAKKVRETDKKKQIENTCFILSDNVRIYIHSTKKDKIMLEANLFFGKKHLELVVKFNELTRHLSELMQVARTIENPSDHDKISSLIVAKIEEQHWLTKAMDKARAEYIEANKPTDVCPF